MIFAAERELTTIVAITTDASQAPSTIALPGCASGSTEYAALESAAAAIDRICLEVGAGMTGRAVITTAHAGC